MREIRTSGTLGDTYIVVCKLLNFKEDIRVYHETQYKKWIPKIKDIYNLYERVKEVRFEEPDHEVETISPTEKDIEPIYFPTWKVSNRFSLLSPYIVLQTHSGKSDGGNRKWIKKEKIEEFLKDYKSAGVVLLGTEEYYADIEGCINLVGATSIYDSIAIIRDCNFFLGPEGFLSFVALSQKKLSIISYKSEIAVDVRIKDTPWEYYCKLIKMEVINGSTSKIRFRSPSENRG